VLAACLFATNKEDLTSGLRRVMAVLLSDTLLYSTVAGFLILPVLRDLPGLTQMFFSISLTNYLMFRFIYTLTVKGRHFRFLASRPMLFMGSISYAFYMFHDFVIHHFTIQHGRPDPMHIGPFLGRMALIYAITIAASTASQYLVEKPAQRLRRYILARPADIRESMALQVPHEPAAYHRKLT
jgi:peptidoglycan/LPS O-acetylase OafA/YrhL